MRTRYLRAVGELVSIPGQKGKYVRGLPGEKVLIEGLTIVHETEKAIQVKHDDWDEPKWFPLSQVDKILRSGKVGGDSLTVSDWIAKKSGIR